MNMDIYSIMKYYMDFIKIYTLEQKNLSKDLIKMHMI